MIVYGVWMEIGRPLLRRVERGDQLKERAKIKRSTARAAGIAGEHGGADRVSVALRGQPVLQFVDGPGAHEPRQRLGRTASRGIEETGVGQVPVAPDVAAHMVDRTPVGIGRSVSECRLVCSPQAAGPSVS